MGGQPMTGIIGDVKETVLSATSCYVSVSTECICSHFIIAYQSDPQLQLQYTYDLHQAVISVSGECVWMHFITA